METDFMLEQAVLCKDCNAPALGYRRINPDNGAWAFSYYCCQCGASSSEADNQLDALQNWNDYNQLPKKVEGDK